MLEFTLKSQEYDGRYMEVTCLQVPNVEDNTSKIEWTLTVLGGEANGYSTGPTTLKIGDQQVYYSARKSYSSKVFPAVKGSVSGSLTVEHDSGDVQLTVSLSTAIYTQTLTETTGQWQLDPISRAAGIRAADAYIGSCSTVVISRTSEFFTHSVFYEFGRQVGFLTPQGDTRPVMVKFRESTVNFLLPESFYQEMTRTKRTTCQLTCVTWLGEQEVGRTECNFWVSADPALCSPVVKAQVTPYDDLTKRLAGERLIPGISTALCQVEATAQKGATLVSVTAGDVPVEEGEALLPGWSLPEVTVVAEDSRGFKTRLTVPSPCLDYVHPTNLAEVARPEPTANCALLTLRGICYSGHFGREENALTAKVEFDGRELTLPVEMGEGSYEAVVELPDISYTRSCQVTVTVADKAMEVTRLLTVNRGLPVFDWGEGDFRFHVPVDLPGLSIGGIPLDTYIRTLQ